MGPASDFLKRGSSNNWKQIKSVNKILSRKTLSLKKFEKLHSSCYTLDIEKEKIIDLLNYNAILVKPM